MKNNFKKILNELSYRVSTGIPDLSNEQHLMKLWDILKEHNWNIDARVELLKSLDEAVKPRYYQADKGQSAPKGAKKGVGPKGGTYYWSNPDGSAADEKDIPDDSDFNEDDYIYNETSTNSEGVSESVSLQTKDEFSDNELKLKALEYGYGTTEKDGKILFKAAPGSDTSMFNEIISGEVTSIIQENPDLTDKEIKAILEERYGDLKGFKKGKNKIKETIAAGRNKHKQMNDGVDLLNEQIDPDTGKEKIGKDVTMRSFYGHKESLEKMVKLVEDSKGPFYTTEGVKIPKDVLIDLIKNSGGGDNPSDTAMIGVDSEGRAVVAFHSDKTDMSDPQANSTVMKQINTMIEDIDKMDLPEEEKKEIKKDLEETKKRIIENERELQQIVVEPANDLSKKLSDDPEQFIEDIKNDARLDRYSDNATKAGQVKTAVSSKLKHITGSPKNKKEFLNDKYLPEGVTEENASEAQKVKAFLDWVGDPERIKENIERIKRGEEPIEPSGDQMKFLQRCSRQNGIPLDKQIGEVKERNIKIQHDAFDKLNERKAPDGTPLGTHIEYENFMKQFHLGDEGVHKYPGLFSISAGEERVDRKKLNHCLGIKDKKSFKERFSVSKPGKGERITYKAGSDKSVITGRDIFYYNDEGKPIAKQTQRSKQGPISKLNTVYAFGPETVDCFRTGKKP